MARQSVGARFECNASYPTFAESTHTLPKSQSHKGKRKPKVARRKTKSLGEGALNLSTRVGRARGPVNLTVLGDPFPIRMRTRLRYAQTNSLTAGSTGLFGTERVFRLNSLYDPDLTGVGHQPYGYDTLATLYVRCKVHAVSVLLTFTDPSADGVLIAAHFQNPDTPTTITGYDTDTVMERPGVWFKQLNNTGSQKVTLKQYFPMWQLCGVTPSQFAANLNDYTSGTTAGPSLTPYLRFAIAAADGSSTPTVRVQTELIFECEFWERQVLPQS